MAFTAPVNTSSGQLITQSSLDVYAQVAQAFGSFGVAAGKATEGLMTVFAALSCPRFIDRTSADIEPVISLPLRGINLKGDL